MSVDLKTSFINRANELTAEYMANNPLATASTDITTVANQYLPNLINRVGLTLLKEAGEFANPLAFASRTDMPLGEYLQTIFVEFVDPEDKLLLCA